MIPKAEQQRTDELLDNILKFWRHVFGGERDLLQIFTAKRDSDGTIDRATIKFEFFAYPKKAEAAAKWALEKSEEGREVYQCSHLLTEPRRVKENAAAVHSLWGDLDGAEVPNDAGDSRGGSRACALCRETLLGEDPRGTER